jgi:hypothetical protein
MQYNPALQNFVNMRKSYVAKSNASHSEAPRSLYQMPKPNTDITLGSIIEHTPSDKDVKEYFKKRVIELVERQEEKEKEKD